jgi:hypothetical protein
MGRCWLEAAHIKRVVDTYLLFIQQPPRGSLNPEGEGRGAPYAQTNACREWRSIHLPHPCQQAFCFFSRARLSFSILAGLCTFYALKIGCAERFRGIFSQKDALQ